MTTEFVSYSYKTWISALSGATAVGFIGLLPLLIVPNEQSKSKRSFPWYSYIFKKNWFLEEKPYLELLLSVAVGSQLADVFLHLLPEAFAHPHASSINIGLWTLIGLFVFFLIEQIFPDDDDDEADESASENIKQKQLSTVNILFFLFY